MRPQFCATCASCTSPVSRTPLKWIPGERMDYALLDGVDSDNSTGSLSKSYYKSRVCFGACGAQSVALLK